MEILVYRSGLWKSRVRVADYLDITGVDNKAIATVKGTRICLPVDQDFALRALRTAPGGCAYVGQSANNEWAKVSSVSDGALYFDGVYDDQSKYIIRTTCRHCGAITTTEEMSRDTPATQQGSRHPWHIIRVRQGLGFDGSVFADSDVVGMLVVAVGRRHKTLRDTAPGRQFWSGQYMGTSYSVLTAN